MIISFEKCYVCGEISHFAIEAGATLLREATCKFCNSSLRNSDTAKILVKSLLFRGLMNGEFLTHSKHLVFVLLNLQSLIRNPLNLELSL